MRLITRMTVAIAVTVLAAAVLYLVFLNDDRQAHIEVLPATDHHLAAASVTDRGEVAWRSRR